MSASHHQETSARDARLDFRLQSEHKKLIEQAAAASGQSVSEFALSHLIRIASETIDRATSTRLNQRDRDAFLRLIMDEAEPNPALKAAADRYRSQR